MGKIVKVAVVLVYLLGPLWACSIIQKVDGAKLPAGVVEIESPEPLEISGVAAVPGGYAVVGDETYDHGRIWPGGARWEIKPPVRGPESVDVGFGPKGEALWLVLGEDGRMLAERNGPTYRFAEKYREVCGRGLEGLALRRVGTEWEVAVLWEGGYDGCGRHAKPRIAMLRWKPGVGTPGPYREFELRVPRPESGERFRAPDLVWVGDELLVLLGSADERSWSFSHTWLQRFDQRGEPAGEPLKLEKAWGSYRDRKNWEAMDWTLDGRCLVMGYDAKRGRRALAVFPWPYPSIKSAGQDRLHACR